MNTPVIDKVDKKMADQNMRSSTKTGGGVMLSPTDMLKMTANTHFMSLLHIYVILE